MLHLTAGFISVGANLQYAMKENQTSCKRHIDLSFIEFIYKKILSNLS